MGWLRRSVAALVTLPVMVACASIPPGFEPRVGEPGADGERPGGGASSSAGPLSAALPEDCTSDARFPKHEMRGAWIATVRNIDWPSEPGLSAQRQQRELRERLDQASALGLNAVFLHVRPTADAVYRSEREPWARYLTGEQGGDPGYDPLEFAVEEAHARGLELHAWFNPYRVGWRDPDLENLTDDHPARRNPDWLIEYDDQGWLDPGNPEVRRWVSDTVLDVVERYDVDGVHFDDYFYPYPAEGEEFDDDASWSAHRGDHDDRGDWRRANVNALVADIHGRIQETKPWVRFGISPFGVWQNETSADSGSATRALESYSAIYADTRAWIQEGTVDYVVPQLYWYRGFEVADYEELVPWWSREVEGTGVDLYIGQAAYNVGEEGWEGADALSRQLDFNAGHPQVAGDVYFSMKDLTGRAADAMERTVADHYPRPALPPAVPGAEGAAPPVAELRAERSADGVRLTWTGSDDARMFAVYRVLGGGDDLCALADASHLAAVVGAAGSGEQEYLDASPAEEPVRYFVTAVDAYRTESAPGPGAAVSTE
ncbi:glycoside hydrolase family 10 protein [Marinitenerispora sediminis]|uniref:Glycosyl hydrolase n=1 Tax=Marinitenerispora sediminis TaxID=1931232 RepID=A0A368T0V9_9ACTN|nr:family 10 glycosylhydrolase [Marinitenerispora sediminis]RCV50406.1 glycosyl hydrolase [Marinitenerispora sediminis]RCV53365.1 glycosyl hydrolase [Marinitenerispora sediminis]RCV56518.1 glycosyl hydrolase [Marinitenerispora sediminis]